MVFTEYDEAKAHCPDDKVVCGTLTETGEPRYFFMAPDASADEMREQSFAVRYGQPMSAYQRMVYAKAKAILGDKVA